jgi:hypothetical protein
MQPQLGRRHRRPFPCVFVVVAVSPVALDRSSRPPAGAGKCASGFVVAVRVVSGAKAV